MTPLKPVESAAQLLTQCEGNFHAARIEAAWRILTAMRERDEGNFQFWVDVRQLLDEESGGTA